MSLSLTDAQPPALTPAQHQPTISPTTSTAPSTTPASTSAAISATTVTPSAVDMTMQQSFAENYQRIMQQMAQHQQPHPTAAAFFPPPAGAMLSAQQNDMKEHTTPTHAALPGCYYDPYMGAAGGYGNPFGAHPLDGSRRKNATRETTQALKAWLYEHRKNPYPTKGEKIMLAILTKMSMTQVSTWFANARRRLKKENKMTWSPRNRPEDEDDSGDDLGAPLNDSTNRPMSGMSDVSGVPNGMTPQQMYQYQVNAAHAMGLGVSAKSPQPPKLESAASPVATKPKIWSIAEQVVASTSSTGDRSDSSRATDKSDTEVNLSRGDKSPPAKMSKLAEPLMKLPTMTPPHPANNYAAQYAASLPLYQQQLAALHAAQQRHTLMPRPPVMPPMGGAPFSPAAMFANPLYAMQMQAMQAQMQAQQQAQMQQAQQQLMAHQLAEMEKATNGATARTPPADHR